MVDSLGDVGARYPKPSGESLANLYTALTCRFYTNRGRRWLMVSLRLGRRVNSAVSRGSCALTTRLSLYRTR